MTEINVEVWQWLTGSLFALVMMMVGGFVGSARAANKYQCVAKDLKRHAEIPGHPVVIEKVRAIENQLDRIEGKLDRVLERGED